MIEEEIFKKSIFDNKKLLEYGFTNNNDIYTYKKNILDNTFTIIITIKENIIKGKIIDIELDEEYTNFRIENNIGEFVNKIRDEFINTLNDIKNNCCINNYYVSSQANRICNYILKKYNDNPEFLWEDDYNDSVFRNKNNKKWYGIIMYININKISNIDKNIEVMNVKLSKERIEKLLLKPGFYKAYHMNKKYWISIVLDDTVDDSFIEELIDESYSYTVDTNEWVIPANPKYFDVINYINDNDIIGWKQSSNIKIGDIIYLYVGSPYSSILCKTKALEVNIPYNYNDDNINMKYEMKLEILKRYEPSKYKFEVLKKYGLNAIRGPRKVPKILLDYIKDNND